MSQVKSQKDIPGYILSIATFLTGIGLLGLVFSLALALFRAPVPGLEFLASKADTPPPAANIGIALAIFTAKLMVLILLAAIASRIASHGVAKYYAASHWAESHQHRTETHNPPAGASASAKSSSTSSSSDANSTPTS